MPHRVKAPAAPSDDAEGAQARRLSNAERAYRALKQLIMTNELAAGAQLLELEAASRLGMSRTPVREAMIRLEQDGVVEIKPRHGMRVLPVSAEDMRDIYEVLASLEATAAEAAARRGPSERDLAALRRAVVEMDAALARDDLTAWSAADERFHRLLVTLSGNRRLMALIEQIWDQVHRVRMMTLRARAKPLASNRAHAAVVEAIARGDGAAAAAIHRAHHDEAARALLDVVRELGLTHI